MIKWLPIILGTILGVFTRWDYQLGALTVLLMGYGACHTLQWPRFQAVLASLYGGLATGLGLQVLARYGMQDQIVAMIVAPFVLWLVLRIFFYGAETRYSLQPLAFEANWPADRVTPANETPQGHSAWSGNVSGQASQPDSTGRYLRYEFFDRGELCMGGPVLGDAVFNNGCAFQGVGPSIALSDDGRHAAMTLPSRGRWGLIIADLQNKIAYEAQAANSPWEIDHIAGEVIYGRESPLTSNSAVRISIDDYIRRADKHVLVEDDGWWVMDYPDREPFPRYGTEVVKSRLGLHRVTFVPDLKPFKANPFYRNRHPSYSVLVDDELLTTEAGYPSALWIGGETDEPRDDGRFLFLGGTVLDFRDPADGSFNVGRAASLAIKPCDEFTHIHFDARPKIAATVVWR